jgi:hypothetical protein
MYAPCLKKYSKKETIFQTFRNSHLFFNPKPYAFIQISLKEKMKKLFYLLAFITPFTLHSQSVINTHPRIFLDPGTINHLQSRAIANTVEWQEIQDRLSAISSLTSFQIMDQVYEGRNYAFFHALNFYATGDIASRDSAVSIFKEYFYVYTEDSSMYWDSGYESRSTLADIAILYDWLYPYMSSQFRLDVRTRLIIWADWILYQPGIYGQFNSTYYFEGNNYTMGHLLGITATGYAIHSEDLTHGNRYIEVSDSVLPLVLNFANTRLHNGDANEGWGYGAGYAVNFFKTLSIIKTATTTHINYYDSTDYDEGVAHFLPHATLPNLTHLLAEGDWARESTGEIWDYNRILADIISTYSNDTTTQRVCRFWGSETLPVTDFLVTSYRWFPFLFSNHEISPLNYRTVSPYTNKYIYTDTIGTDQFIQRTGWLPNSQWISYRGGGRYGDHAHNGAGHFSLYENGWLLIDENIKTSSGIEGSDSMQNCTQVETMNGIEMYPFNDYDQAEHTFQKRVEILPEYTYFWSDHSPIYLARESYNIGELNVVTQKERQFFYLPAIKKVAIFDLVETELPSQSKWFGTHFWDIPTLAANGRTLTYSNDSTTAYVTTCYPPNPVVEVFGNSARTSNATAHSKDYFMHLVHTQKVGTAPIQVIPVDQTDGNLFYSNFYGSFHEDNSENYVLLFNGNDPAYTFDSVSYIVPVTSANLKNYLMGVSESHNYYVTYQLLPGAIQITVHNNNTPGSALFTSSSQGVLFFELGPLPVSIQPVDNPYANIFYNAYQHAIDIKSLEAMGNVQFSLMDMHGQTIFEYTSFAESELSIPAPELSTGIYIVHLITEKGMMNRKLLISQ